MKLEIKPLEGFGALEFGASPEEVFKLLGQPDEDEVFEDDEEGSTTVYHFWDLQVSAFFENEEEPGLINIETDNPEATLFGKKVFTLKEDELIKLMEANGFNEIDTEVMESEDAENEKRVSFDDAMIDFFFEDNVLSAVSWGVFLEDYDEDEE